MATTTHLGITLVDQSQAQKEVTVNQAFTCIDALLNNGAKSRSVNAPPGSPASGDLYIVGTTPTGAWAGQAKILVYFDQIWRFITPNTGMTLWVNDESLIYTYNGTAWVASIFGETNTASNLGAGTGVYGTKVGVDLRFKSLLAGTNVSISNTSNDITINAAGAYQTIDNGGTALTQRSALNFTGTGITAADNAANTRTDVTLAAPLNALASYNTNGILVQTAANTFVGRTITAGIGMEVISGSGVLGNPTIQLDAATSDLYDTAFTTFNNGDMLIYSGSAWRNLPSIWDTSYIRNSSDGTKCLAFALGGSTTGTTTTLTAAQTANRAITLPDATTTLAGTSSVNAFTKQQYFVQTTLTDAASIAWDVGSNQVAKVTLGGNRTLSNPTNLQAGATYTLVVKQDATGSRTLAYGSNYKWPAGAAPTLTTAANATDILTFICDGTNMYGVAQKAFA